MTIKLTINGAEVELSVAAAKALHKQLSDVFGKTPLVIEHEKLVPYPVYHQPVPVYIERPKPFWCSNEIICQSDQSSS